MQCHGNGIVNPVRYSKGTLVGFQGSLDSLFAPKTVRAEAGGVLCGALCIGDTDEHLKSATISRHEVTAGMQLRRRVVQQIPDAFKRQLLTTAPLILLPDR